MIFQRRGVSVTLLVGLAALTGCGGGTGASPAVVTPVATTPVVAVDTPAPAAATPAPPTETAAPEATPTAVPAATEATAEAKVTFELVSTLSTVEEVEHIQGLLEDVEGILAVTGTEVSITIAYDPALLTVAHLADRMEQLGYPVKPP